MAFLRSTPWPEWRGKKKEKESVASCVVTGVHLRVQRRKRGRGIAGRDNVRLIVFFFRSIPMSNFTGRSGRQWEICLAEKSTRGAPRKKWKKRKRKKVRERDPIKCHAALTTRRARARLLPSFPPLSRAPFWRDKKE